MKNGSKFTLKFKKGIIPAIVQDASSGKVLSLYYLDRKALEKTKKTGFLWRFSRTFGRVVKKGAQSGNTQRVVSVEPDCEGKSLLVRVVPNGPACHKGRNSCYDDGNFLFELERIIGGRRNSIKSNIKKNAKEKIEKNSYTAFLLSNPAKMRAKIVEEAFELAAAKTKKDTVWEAADLIYIILVLCAERGIKLYDVSNELGRRNAEKSRYSKRL